ncbi:aldose epimerase family protein [uncultured Sphingomonas sp.]|uniref:aldose epimerase family protein n=1 Tax=uncultured Sphingomonas sp. TaxID=158754 RepID=UPI0025F53BF8|nr:aldose epimerase family protein [uncultured Sphingomonas sp.]
MSEIEVVEIARGPVRAQFLTLGATLRRLEVPDRQGRIDNVVLGYADLDDYRRQPPRYYGAVAGRYANRIAGGRFTLDGETFQLTTNEGGNSLHSGPDGFDQQVWAVEARSTHAVTFRLDSPHGWNGFPGDLVVRVEYALEEDGLAVRFTATPDRATIINLTQHAYFNLAGEGSDTTILDHVLQLPASAITPVNGALIPTGALAPVDGTPFDFRSPKPIGRDIDAENAQLALGQGYDHNFVLDGPAGFERRIATLFDPGSGRVLDLHSTEPGVQVYSGNYLADGAPGTSGGTYPKRGGLCLEPQKFPDSPNQPSFPSARLEAGESYRHNMAFRFRTAADVAEAFPL